LDIVFQQAIRVSSQGSFREWNSGKVGERMDLVVDDAPVFPVGKSAYLFVRNSFDNLLDDLFTLAPNDQVDIGTTVKETVNLFRRLVATDDRADLWRQLGHETGNLFVSGFPRDTYAEKIDSVPDKLV
jgi:hypothetical protein